jgi:F-type H+-transporting ATPase subunit b
LAVLNSSIFLLPNGTFFVELAVFLIIIGLIAKYILPPLNRAMEQRQEHIRSSLQAADAARTEAAAADDERRAALDEARKQSREIVAQANRTAEQVKAEMGGRGQVEYDRIVANAENEVALARRRAVEEASERMGELVLEVVERIIGREVDAATHRDLIDEAVAALNATDGSATAGSAGHRS